MKTLIPLLLTTATIYGAEGWIIQTNESGMVTSVEQSRRIDPFATPEPNTVILSTGTHQGKTTYKYPPLSWQQPSVERKYWTVDSTGFHALDQAGRDALHAELEAQAQAERDARPTRALEQAMLAKLTELDALIGTSFATSVPFEPGMNLQIAAMIEAFVGTASVEDGLTAVKLGARLDNLMTNIVAIDSTALYAENFGQ